MDIILHHLIAINTLSCTWYLNPPRNKITERIRQSVRRTQNPTEIFENLIKYLTDERCSIPPYTVLQDAIGAAFSANDHSLVEAIEKHLPIQVKTALDDLLTKNGKKYLITFLKFDAKTFQANQVQKELKNLRSVNLYTISLKNSYQH